MRLYSPLIPIVLVLGMLAMTNASMSELPVSPTPAVPPAPPPAVHRDGPLEVWAWNGEFAPAVIRKQLPGLTGVDNLIPGWFELVASDGEVYDVADEKLVRDIRKQGMEVTPLVSNKHRKAMTTEFLADPEAVDRFVESLTERFREVGLAGANLDFEGVEPQSRDTYAAFVEKLAKTFRANSLGLTVDVPVTETGELPVWFDAKRIAAAADQVVLMAYDQFYEGSEHTGPVSGMEWTEAGIRQAIAVGVPADKIVLGVPLYTREWQLDKAGKPMSSRPLSMKALDGTLIGYEKVDRKWDSEHGLYRVKYKDGKGSFEVWEENTATVEARYALAREYGLHGVAVWRLGYEPKDFWKKAEAWKTNATRDAHKSRTSP
ncbi:glycosyl hydrolase family 18 protein [Paenibacillus hodogayensis]|uniref:Glycosyl hydrolase family 18 protein n=1 Tax=Paenibacillus hodogayensis TaxID=279208 RepID=A0ABV5VZW0_9BACL